MSYTPQILLDSKLNQLATKPTTYSPEVPFQEFFDDALTTKESMIKPTVPQKSPVVAMNNTMDPLTLSKNGAVLAQAVNSTPVNRENNRKKISTDNKSKSLDNAEKKVTHTPFQLFIDQAIEVLDRISQQESYVNNLTEDYISGKVSILLQAYLSRKRVEAFSLVSDANYILANATRLFRTRAASKQPPSICSVFALVSIGVVAAVTGVRAVNAEARAGGCHGRCPPPRLV